jgi:acid stress-induced BolA-like protein IbaG/YrbA
MTKEQLQEALEKLPDVERVSVIEDRRRLIATVVSGAFRDQNEGVRQRGVRAHLYREFGESEDELAIIEFIFTNTPEEEAENAA